MILRRPEEIQIMREANRIVACVLLELPELIRPGITTGELDRFMESRIRSYGAEPAFLGYRGYPAASCISVNEQVVHGIPGNRRIRDGDLVSVDLGVLYRGYYGDAARSYGVGRMSQKALKLMKVTEEALYKGIEQAKVGNRLFDISRAIQDWVERHGFSVVREFVGHGIGQNLHEDPQVPNYVPKTPYNPLLEAGMVLALEPMVNAGGHRVKVLPDGWTAVSADGSLSAHFEHTVAITDNGPEILSLCH
ncbi:MAG: type I methionyl aminopeptidase [Thermodesulfobacteriota bacterium]